MSGAWPTDPKVLPDSIVAVRAFLLQVPEVTALVGNRIVTRLPVNPTWPAIRLTLISAFMSGFRRVDTATFQVDCFSPDEATAHRIARIVRAALADCQHFVTPTAVLLGGADLAVRPLPDESFTPPIQRYAVSASVFVRSNP